MAKLTQAEASTIILTALLDYQRQRQRQGSPTLRELSKLTYMSVSALVYRLERMETAGLIQREPRIARGIRVLAGD